jgi:GTPase SAR1 family protein
MSFVLKAKRTDSALAKVVGGSDKGKYLYLENKKKLLSDLPKKYTDTLSDVEKQKIQDALTDGLEPAEIELEELYYNTLEEFNKMKTRGFVLRGGGKFQLLPNTKRVEKLYVCGISGSGKSTYSSKWIKEYLKTNKDNEMFIFSTVDEDEPLDKLNPIRVDLDGLMDNPVSLEELRDSVCLFDDCATISDPRLRKYVIDLMSHLLEVGRHYNITVVNTAHVILDYKNSRKILNEATSVTIYPHVGSNVLNKKYLEHYAGFDSKQIAKILNLPSRWVSLYRTFPNFVIYEKGAYLV